MQQFHAALVGNQIMAQFDPVSRAFHATVGSIEPALQFPPLMNEFPPLMNLRVNLFLVRQKINPISDCR